MGLSIININIGIKEPACESENCNIGSQIFIFGGRIFIYYHSKPRSYIGMKVLAIKTQRMALKTCAKILK